MSVALPAAIAAGEASAPQSAGDITPESYLAHLRVLASDALEGRLPGTPGSLSAGEYIRDQFSRSGLLPAGPGGDWFQPFEIKRGKQLDKQAAQLEIAGLSPAPQLEQDWITFPFSQPDDAAGPLVFAGYGIEAPDAGYNDYADLDATGKFLLIFRHEPRAADESASFGGKQPSEHALFSTKLRVAKKKGALGVLVVQPPLREPKDESLYLFDGARIREPYDLPCAHITVALAERLLASAKLPPLSELQSQLDTTRKPLSHDLKTTVRLAPGVVPIVRSARNIVARLPGDGSSDDYVVVGAHYDHLGNIVPRAATGDRTPVIHNGADDNASGTSGLLELARTLARGPKLHRHVLFIAFDGEEMGLLGSKHFVDKPTVPLEKVRAMVNFDMIGKLSQRKLTIYGATTATEFPALVERYYGKPGPGVYRLAQAVPGNSDHHSFYRKKIPVFFPFTGVHSSYHQPSDDWELIDVVGAAEILGVWSQIIRDLANMTSGPTFTESKAPPSPEDLVKKPAEEEAAEPGRNAPDAQRASGAPSADRASARAMDDRTSSAADAGDDRPPQMPPVRLGIMPDYAGDDQPGLLVESVRPDSAAKEAGMLDGDRILRIGDMPITGIDSYMTALRKFKPDDLVEIEVQRKTEKLVLKARARGPSSPRSGS